MTGKGTHLATAEEYLRDLARVGDPDHAQVLRLLHTLDGTDHEAALFFVEGLARRQPEGSASSVILRWAAALYRSDGSVADASDYAYAEVFALATEPTAVIDDRLACQWLCDKAVALAKRRSRIARPLAEYLLGLIDQDREAGLSAVHSSTRTSLHTLVTSLPAGGTVSGATLVSVCRTILRNRRMAASCIEVGSMDQVVPLLDVAFQLYLTCFDLADRDDWSEGWSLALDLVTALGTVRNWDRMQEVRAICTDAVPHSDARAVIVAGQVLLQQAVAEPHRVPQNAVRAHLRPCAQ